MTQTKTVAVSRRLAATPEQAFDAWLDPAIAGRFLFATPTGQMVRVEIDAREGGTFEFVDRRDGQDVLHKGRYLQLDRPRRLVFEFLVPQFSTDVTRVAVDIAPVADGAEVTLTHDGVLVDYVAQTRQGWTMILENLAGALG